MTIAAHPTLSRRRLLVVAAVVGSVAALGLPITAVRAQSTEAARAFVQRTGSELVAVINANAPDAQRRQQLADIVSRNVDIAGIGRFCLGTHWRAATPAEQQEYLQLFSRVLVTNVTGRLGEYHGVTFSIGRAIATDAGTSVQTTVVRPGNQPNQVEWIIRDVGGTPKIVDVVAEGASLRQTQRSDYEGFLQQHGDRVGTLIDAMRRQQAG